MSQHIPSTRTAQLLACGIVAGPLFLAGALIQAFARDGYDLSRHPISLSSLEDLGWIQIANFVLTGSLYLACAVGLRRALQQGKGRRWSPVLVGDDWRWVAACVTTAAAVLGLGLWPDTNGISVRLLIATAILFGFVSALAAHARRLPQPAADFETAPLARSRP
jgi:hypothetical protein